MKQINPTAVIVGLVLVFGGVFTLLTGYATSKPMMFVGEYKYLIGSVVISCGIVVLALGYTKPNH